MSKDLGAAGDLPPKAPPINFKINATLSRPIGQPAIVNDPVGLVVFGDSALGCMLLGTRINAWINGTFAQVRFVSDPPPAERDSAHNGLRLH